MLNTGITGRYVINAITENIDEVNDKFEIIRTAYTKDEVFYTKMMPDGLFILLADPCTKFACVDACHYVPLQADGIFKGLSASATPIIFKHLYTDENRDIVFITETTKHILNRDLYHERIYYDTTENNGGMPMVDPYRGTKFWLDGTKIHGLNRWNSYMIVRGDIFLFGIDRLEFLQHGENIHPLGRRSIANEFIRATKIIVSPGISKLYMPNGSIWVSGYNVFVEITADQDVFLPLQISRNKSARAI